MGKRGKIVLIVLIILIALTFGQKRNNNETGAILNTLPSPTSAIEYSEWAVPSLRSRTYDSEITVERESGRAGEFKNEVIIFESDGLKQYALMATPFGKVPASGFPVIILNHGHVPPSAYSTINSYKALSEYYPRAGFVMIKPDYRGHGQSEGGAESLTNRIGYSIDILNLLAGVEKLPNIDKSRIYMWGHSMGGEVTLRVLEVTDKVKAAVLWAPAARDWPENVLHFARRGQTERAERLKLEYEQLFGGGRDKGVATLDGENLKLIKIPVLVQHATGDASVPYEWGQYVTQKMQEAGITTELVTYQGDDHNIVSNRAEAQKRDVEWFK